MKDIIFADGMNSVSLTNGAIRLTLYKKLLDEEGKPGMTEEKMLVMSMQGFADAFIAMYKLSYLLQKDGLIEIPDLPAFSDLKKKLKEKKAVLPEAVKEEQSEPEQSDEQISPNFE